MVLNNHLTERQPLSSAKIDAYRRQAEKILVKESNLFAELLLRVIASYELQAAELDVLRRTELDRLMEAELLARENQQLRTRLVELEVERTRLVDQLRRKQHEAAEIKKKKVQLPPSWE